MKIRNGFVSNSSSSSFIVKYSETTYEKLTDPKPKKKKIVYYLIPEELKLLEKSGFKKTAMNSPTAYEFLPEKEFENKKTQNKFFKNYWCNLAYNITCNQDDVICFLLKNNIGFTASCHYGHESVFYKKDEEYFYIIPNLGLSFETYGIDDKHMEMFKDSKIQKIKVVDFIKDYDELIKRTNEN